MASYLRDMVATNNSDSTPAGTTRLLCQGDFDRWVCLEPDPTLAGRLEESVRRGELPACCKVEVGTIEQVPEGPEFDTLAFAGFFPEADLETFAQPLSNLNGHPNRNKVKGVEEMIQAAGARVVYLPPYSPDFNPIELA